MSMEVTTCKWKERERLSYLAPVTMTLMRETPQSVRFVKTTMERIGLGVIAVASFSTQVV